ncbi:MAG TPA: tripartite tricarboxylate transporter substrate-binding protein [candidate division Zixibacteria bacterium]|nr:tripartite tricarboxylate transporter substrate-binding protein [candidate division Zixibacteria bacterium]
MPNMKAGFYLGAAALALALGASPVRADEFYRGKTLRFVVGLAPGGGYDLSARTVARHIGKHIPGHPTVVVENMTGAGSLRAANYTFNSARPDGLFVGIWNSALVLRQALGDPAMRFDARKFGWIGAPTKGTPHCSIMAHTGLKTLKDVLATTREIKMGSTGPGSTYDDTPKILNQTIGTKFKVVSGYEGTGPILVAMRRKEIDGGCWGWESARTTARSLLDATGEEKLIPFIIHRREPDPEVKDLPLIPEVIKGEDNLSAYRTWVGTFEFQRPFMLPPAAPRDRLLTLRKAFAETMQDPEFKAEATKSKLEITYVAGDEIDRYVDQIMSITPKARELLSFLMVKPKK